MDEQEWVKSWVSKLDKRLKTKMGPVVQVAAADQQRLIYAYEIGSYDGTTPSSTNSELYRTDLLVWELKDKESWVPRVVVETKLKSVTSHDALTYSAKAFTHKQVHPYLRYGLLIGNYGKHPLPSRLFRHGAHFDFMTCWEAEKATPSEWSELIEVLQEEFIASQDIEAMLAESRKKNRRHIKVVHKKLVLK